MLITDYANKQLCQCYQQLRCDVEHMFPVAGKCFLQEPQSSSFSCAGPAVKIRLNAACGWLGKAGAPQGPPSPPTTSLLSPCGFNYCGCLLNPSAFKNEPLGAFLASPAKCCTVNITRQACSKPLKSTANAPPALQAQAAAKYSPGRFPFIKCELYPGLQGRGVG